MKVTVIGTGYVGLVAGACFAETGNNVICIDIDENKIAQLKKSVIPIYEPGLEELVKRNQENGNLVFSTDTEYGVKNSDIIFIAVGTPPDEDGSADLKHVLAVAAEIGKHADGYKIVVDKSTVPVGTGYKVLAEIKKYTDHEIDVVSNPEFLKEGAAVKDFLYPDRVVIGADNPKALAIMRELYEPFVRNGNPIIEMDITSAELTKYAANALLATKISFMNDMANLAEKLGADIDMVRKGIGSDSRIGYSFIYPGAGYGGSCFPKDVKAIIHTGKKLGYDLRVLQAVEEVNDRQKIVLMPKIFGHFGKEDLSGLTFAVWGLSFKPNTDDMREAPSLYMIDALHAAGAKIQAHDPVAMEEAERRGLGEKAEFFDNQYDALDKADALILLTEWNHFRRPDFDLMKAKMARPVVFDGRNIYDKKRMEDRGFTYYGIGR
jgi:UDPglucose 6-dehydrogenase